MGRKLSFGLMAVLVMVAIVGLTAQIASAAAVIGTGDIRLGVNDEGHLNYTDGVTRTSNAGPVGVAIYFPDGSLRDATAPGCLCEGWGAAATSADGLTTYHGGADISVGGVSNITVDSFASTASTATSVVHLTDLPGLTITQAYAPSASASLFQNRVTFTNTTGDVIKDIRYTRVMDWDVPPTEFDEYVTIAGLPATNLSFVSDNGFANPDPVTGGGRSDIGGCGVNANFFDCGASDHGALFDFSFGDLAAGDSRSFSIYYGATLNEKDALAALGTVGAEVYSLGQSNTADGPSLGTPATFIFGFGEVGGIKLPPPDTNPIPEPATMFLFGSGLVGLCGRIRRK